jgi:glycosyltransferase involved in cell wall biosynthesis
VLLLLPSVPVPADAGARLRNGALLRALGTQHQVDAVAFGRAADRPGLASLAQRAVVVPPPPARHAARRTLDVLRADWPDMALRQWSPEFLMQVRRALASEDYAVVQAEGIEMARYLAPVDPRRRVYDAHNAEFLLQRRASQTARSWVGTVYSRLQWRRLERFEGAVVRQSALTLAVSEHDANQFLALAGPRANVQVVPNAIDVGSFSFRQPQAGDAPNMLFVGKLDFRPNADAVHWLLHAVLPWLHAEVPTARLFVVGGGPPKWLVRAGQHDDRLAVTGYVADERPYLARSSVLVLPVRMGGGSRLKALVAMASGVPIVSTRLGMEGLEAEPDRHFLRAESAEDWVSALKRLLGDPDLRAHLASNARALVQAEYDVEVLPSRLRRAYRGLLP